MFHGFDFDGTMLRIGSMNMLLHGVENPDIRYRDSLSEEHAGETEQYSLVLANPPFAGSLDYETTAKDLLQVVKTKKTELLFLALFLRLLKPGGRAAVIVPDGVLFGSRKAHKELRRMLVEDQKLDGVVKLPERRVQALRRRLDRDPAVHQDRTPAAPTTSGSTTSTADGWSPRRQAHPAARRGQARRRPRRRRSPTTSTPRTTCPTSSRAGTSATAAERERARTEQSFCVPEGRHRRATATTSRSIATRKSSTSEVEHRPPVGDHRRARAAGGRDSAGDEGAGRDAGVSGSGQRTWPSYATSRSRWTLPRRKLDRLLRMASTVRLGIKDAVRSSATSILSTTTEDIHIAA